MMDYILISTAVAGMVFFVALFLHSRREARDENQEIRTGEVLVDGFWSERAASPGVPGIFSNEDRKFVLGEGSEQVATLFRRERRRLALRWIERQKRESAGIMRRHREASRSAADLKPASEVALFVRYGKLRLMLEVLAVSVWLVGPEGLHGMAERADAVLRGIGNVKALGANNRSISA
jgi:hypothetical protein